MRLGRTCAPTQAATSRPAYRQSAALRIPPACCGGPLRRCGTQTHADAPGRGGCRPRPRSPPSLPRRRTQAIATAVVAAVRASQLAARLACGVPGTLASAGRPLTRRVLKGGVVGAAHGRQPGAVVGTVDVVQRREDEPPAASTRGRSGRSEQSASRASACGALETGGNRQGALAFGREMELSARRQLPLVRTAHGASDAQRGRHSDASCALAPPRCPRPRKPNTRTHKRSSSPSTSLKLVGSKGGSYASTARPRATTGMSRSQCDMVGWRSWPW